MRVLLDQGFIEEIYRRFHIEDEEDIAGAYILLLGELRVGPSGKKYVQIGESSTFTLSWQGDKVPVGHTAPKPYLFN